MSLSFGAQNRPPPLFLSIEKSPTFYHVGDFLFAADGDDHEPYIVPFVTAGHEDH